MRIFTLLFLMTLLTGNIAFSNNSCRSLFGTELVIEQSFDELTNISSSLDSLIPTVKRAASQKIKDDLQELQGFIEELFEYMISDSPSERLISSKLARIETRFKTVKKNLIRIIGNGKTIAERKVNTSFEALVENPDLTLTDRAYDVPTPNGHIKVSFSHAVTENILNDAVPLQQKIAKSLLSAISHGFVRGGGAVGIKLLQGNSKTHVYEVKILGSGRQQRLVGYLSGDTLRLVAYSEKHLDAILVSAAIIRKVLEVRKKELSL